MGPTIQFYIVLRFRRSVKAALAAKRPFAYVAALLVPLNNLRRKPPEEPFPEWL